MEYSATVTFIFDADSPEEAAEMFRERLVEGQYSVLVTNLETGEDEDVL